MVVNWASNLKGTNLQNIPSRSPQMLFTLSLLRLTVHFLLCFAIIDMQLLHLVTPG